MNKNFITSYYIGLNDKDEHKQLLLTDTYKDKINRVLQAFGKHGFTIVEAQGFYKGELENTLIIQLGNIKLDKIIINSLKQELNQECIMEVVTPCNVRFI